jgi:hypothetical protein
MVVDNYIHNNNIIVFQVIKTKKSEYAEYLRQRHYARSTELSKSLGKSKHDYEEMIKRQSDDEMISSYLSCSCCGYEILSKKEMESLIQKYDDPERIYNELPSGHE